MIKKTQLPEQIITGTRKTRDQFRIFEKPKVEKLTLEGIDEIQHLYVAPWTSIKMHGHDENQWEVWARISHKTAHICLKGEKHELVNNSGEMMILMAIKGHGDYSYEDFSKLFEGWGFSVSHGSLIVND